MIKKSLHFQKHSNYWANFGAAKKWQAILLIVFLASIFTPVTKAVASGTTLSVSGGTQTVNTTFNSVVRFTTGGNNICAVKANLQFPTNLLEVTGLDHGQTFATDVNEAVKQYSNQDGKIYYTLGIPGCTTSSNDVLIITFKAKKVGNGEIKFLDTNIVTADNAGVPSSINANIQNTSFSIVKQSVATTNNTATKKSTTKKTPITTVSSVKVKTPSLTGIEYTTDAVLDKTQKRVKGIKLTGTADPKASVYITINNGPTTIIRADTAGKWEDKNYDWLNDGSYPLTAKAELSGRLSSQLITMFTVNSAGSDQIAIGAKLPGKDNYQKGNEIIKKSSPKNVIIIASLLAIWLVLIVVIVRYLVKKSRKQLKNKTTE